MTQKRFIIRKYVTAGSAAEAIRKEAQSPVEEVYVDDKAPAESSASAIGFHYQPTEEE